MLCIITENGYELECSGRKIPFDGITVALLAGLSEEEFSELKNTNVNLLSQIQMKSSITTIESKIDGLSSNLNRAIKETLETQKKLQLDHSKCPVNKEHVINIVAEWHDKVIMADLRDPTTDLGARVTNKIINDVKDYVKTSLLTGGNIAKAITAILLLIALVTGYIFTLTEIFTK